MPWVALRKIKPVGALVLPGDVLPRWMQTAAMIRAVKAVYGEDAVTWRGEGPPSGAAPAPPPAPAADAQPEDREWARWAEAKQEEDADAVR